jgi:Zn-dependent protease
VPPQPRPSGLRIASVAGVPVLLTPSWFLFAAYIVLLYQPLVDDRVGEGPAYALGAALALMLLASVLLHELAHCLVARAFGLPVRSITVTLLSGRTEITQPPQTPDREYAVAISGPLVSLVLTAISSAVLHAFPEGSISREVMINLAITNGAITALNLLPGLPLDGGRVLRSVLWRLGGDANRATRAAARVGIVVGTVVVPVVLLVVLPATGIDAPGLMLFLMSLLVGTFIVVGARASLQQAQLASRLPALSAATLARPALTVPATLPLSEAVRLAHEQRLRAMVVVTSTGQPEGIVNEAWVRDVPAERRPWVVAADGARRVEPGLVLDADLTGEALLEAMSRTPASEYLVAGPTPRVLVSTDVAAAITT